MGGGGWSKKFMGWEARQSCLYPLGQTLVCVVTGLKRSINYNKQNLKEKDLNFTRKGTSSLTDF